MRFAGTASNKRPASACSTIDEWHRFNLCPVSGSGQRLVHFWIPEALRACRHFEMDYSASCEWVEQHMSRPPQSPREITDWADRVFSESGSYKPSGPKEEKAKYEPDFLQRVANQVPFDIDRRWLQERSPVPTDSRPEQFLHALYDEGESIVIVTKEKQKYDGIWTNDEDLTPLDRYRTGHDNVWFLANPVTGKSVETRTGLTWRSEQNVTSWRYFLIESDTAPEHLWLKLVVQLPFKISAIYTSGGKSIHCLVRINAGSKQEWDAWRDAHKRSLVRLGACVGSMSGVRLTRLASCVRGETGKLQELLWLNPSAEAEPIYQSKKETPE